MMDLVPVDQYIPVVCCEVYVNVFERLTDFDRKYNLFPYTPSMTAHVDTDTTERPSRCSQAPGATADSSGWDTVLTGSSCVINVRMKLKLELRLLGNSIERRFDASNVARRVFLSRVV